MRPRFARPETLRLTAAEFRILARLDTPARIQAFVDAIPANFEPDGDTVLSVREVLRRRRAHCIEGAMLAACALWIHGEPPLIVDFEAVHDYDHVVAVFRRAGCWGAISKTNHVALRYRDPVYRSLRELAMSYFHEYSNRRGQKTLRTYSRPLDLRSIDPALWVTRRDDCFEIAERLDELRHFPLVSKRQARGLRTRDRMERRAHRLREHPPPARVRRQWAEALERSRARKARR